MTGRHSLMVLLRGRRRGALAAYGTKGAARREPAGTSRTGRLTPRRSQNEKARASRGPEVITGRRRLFLLRLLAQLVPRLGRRAAVGVVLAERLGGGLDRTGDGARGGPGENLAQDLL